MNGSIGISVVGCGYWGPNLVRNFTSLPECHVKKVCDLAPERLAYIQRLYPGVEVTTSFQAILDEDDIDAVAIATPVSTHFSLAKQALQAGKHVLIEKPMASSVAECQELMELAATKDRIIMAGHTFIYSSPVRLIKKIVDAGDLGDIYYISSQRLNLGLFQKDINVTWDLAPHDISIILFLIGQDPVSVNCRGNAHINANVEDVTSLTMEFPNKTFSMIQSSWLDPNKVRRMTIVGSKKMLLYDDNEPLEKIKLYDKRVETPPHYDTFAEFQYSYHYGDVHIPYIKQAEPLKILAQHFLECILTGSKPETSGLEGMQVVKILVAASESLKRGGGKVDLSKSPLLSSKTMPGYQDTENTAAVAEARGRQERLQEV
ncbi:Gfo/Idh/MocA family oxidoreductase [candidate division KSB1 bacterium]|nr:Gfo/Idh/MocA family oxidoreductase [candidate division KSB1 bacterium]NIR72509.1 Gfo/Idh/MocA family oxidoreductase [candidate division KSB1 bacterium]NIS23617.1 Gfo/Idh/MocA family oxidoreductase [candidate division KSB1 bacterium]NIT70543.1 Gfo/Idh/MocA family oxidoreductase [candidate division KSB1 bacterium]NIU24250.1 Gfo/Idh/MocA family oxidoreductase [candidate division KSB1 bacterium]